MGGDDGGGDGRVGSEGVLDFGGFDAVATDADLVVGAAEEVEVAVGPPAGEVASAVEAAAVAGVGVGDEPFGGAGGLVQIPARDPGPADVQFPR
ncbi:hypothetical protein [Dactylosporangium darangshiense]|uniref:hypothetical protein n=1 Tax=Dactylosporangium darangshiense TaxID=579108 RepID=UPI00363F4AE9